MPSSSELVAVIARSRPALSASSISSALVPRDRAVVRAHELDAGLDDAALDRELGELLRDALGEPPRVDEHDRRAMREDQVEQPRIDQRPHARRRRRRRGARVVHVGGGHDDLEIERRLARSASTISTGRSPPRYRATSISGRWVADRPIRCGSGLPALVTRCASRSSVSARWMPRLVGASAWISSTMIGLDRAQPLARRPGEQQVQRLGRRDQDLAGLLALALALLRPACRRCARRP